MRLVKPCSVPSCQSEGTVELSDDGRPIARYCPDCWAIIDLILDETSRLVKLGTPREIAAEWASAAVGRLC